MKIKNRPVFLIVCLIPKEQNSTDRREKWESLLCHYSLPNDFRISHNTQAKQNNDGVWLPPGAGRDQVRNDLS